MVALRRRKEAEIAAEENADTPTTANEEASAIDKDIETQADLQEKINNLETVLVRQKGQGL